MLLQALWGGSDYREPRTIDVHVRHLREKLERDPREPEFILTVRGVGYRFRTVKAFVRSVGAQLSLALLLVVAIALGVVYLTVVPSLRDRAVEHARRPAGADRRHGCGTQVTDATPFDPDFVATASQQNGSVRVALLNRIASQSPVVSAAATRSRSLAATCRATRSRPRIARRRQAQARDGRRRTTRSYAEAAVPVLGGHYALLVRAPVELGSIQLVERRVLLAAGVALLIALLLGYGGARMFARRIRRLERAADRIADGRFDEPVVDTGGDELGELAAAFERMRVRLAHLDDARREFVANASHELRTPLFSLGGFLELLDDEELDEPTRREFLGSMREQVDRLTKLASDLLDLTRLDAGRLTRRAGAGRPGGAGGATSSRSSRRSRRSSDHRLAVATSGERRRWPRRTSSACCRSAGSWSRTRSCTRRRERRSRSGRSQRGEHAVLEVEDAGARDPRGAARSSCSSASSASTARARPAAASASRSRSSSRS